MKIGELLAASFAELRSVVTLPEVNPLTEVDVLQEAQVVGAHFDALSLNAAILFDLRMALQLRGANTGVLLVRGVRDFSWNGPKRFTKLTAWSIGASEPSVNAGIFNMKLSLWPAPGAQLNVVAGSAVFVLGDVPSLGDIPPDYSAGMGAGVANWDSEYGPVHAAFLESVEEPETGD